jgi:PAS domain S-box-containing protein
MKLPLNWDDPGREWWREAGAVAVAILLAVIVTWLVWTARAAEQAQTQAYAREIHTLNVIRAGDEVLKALQSGETGQRGYMLTRDETFLEPYDDARLALPGALARLKQLTSDNAMQQQRVSLVEDLARQRWDQFDRSIAMVRSGVWDQGAVPGYLANGKRTMDAFRAEVGAIATEEQRLLASRSREAAAAADRAAAWRGVLSVVAILLTLLAAAITWWLVRVRREATANKIEAETNLRLAEGRRFLQLVMDASPDAIFVKDREHKLTLANRRVGEIFGQPYEDMIGTVATGVVPPEKEGFYQARDEAIMAAGKPVTVEDDLIVHGEPRKFMTDVIPWRRDGQVMGMIGIARDVTDSRANEARLEQLVAARTAQLTSALEAKDAEMAEREAAEAQLRQMHKIESIGQLTGGIAHDFNNMLAIVIGSLSMARQRLPGDADARLNAAIANAEEGAKRAADLTTRLLAFARQQPLDPHPVAINTLIESMAKLLERTLGGTITLDIALDPHAGWVEVDAPQLESAIVNLSVNARDAMPQGGTLTLATKRDGDEVWICVSDTGPGMSDEVRARAFDPFFTTKEQGKGTGLGLSQVHGFVGQSGGRVELSSIEGQGTQVQIVLPSVEPPATEPEPAAASQSEPVAAGAHILLVEDEPLVRMVAVEALEHAGFIVEAKSNGADALEVVRSEARIDLLLTDVSMPGMDGRALAEATLAQRPDLPILLVTGYEATRPPVAREVMLLPVLAKPYTAEELAQAAGAAIARGNRANAAIDEQVVGT